MTVGRAARNPVPHGEDNNVVRADNTNHAAAHRTIYSLFDNYADSKLKCGALRSGLRYFTACYNYTTLYFVTLGLRSIQPAIPGRERNNRLFAYSVAAVGLARHV